MTEMLLATFVIVLSIIGASYSVMRIALFFLTRKDKSIFATLLLCSKDADLRLITFLEGLKWNPYFSNYEILAVDCGLDSQTYAVCESLISKYANVTLLSKKAYLEKTQEMLERQV